MRRGRIFIYLAFILILGLVAVFIVYQQYLSPQNIVEPSEPVPTQVVELVNVLVVTQRVPRGTTLDESVLGVVPIQRELFMEGMFTEISDVEGRLVKFDLDAGIPLTSGMLVDTAEQLSSTGSVAALSIPRGMVAVSIPVNRLSSVSYAPRAGDRVNVIVSMLLIDLDTDFQTVTPNDVGTLIAPGTEGELGPNYLTVRLEDVGGEGEVVVGSPVGKLDVVPGLDQPIYSVPSEGQRPRLVSQSLLQDAVVLGVGNFPLEEKEEEIQEPDTGEEPAPAPSEGETPEQEVQPPEPPDVITLIVTPQDAITLNYLIFGGGQLTLALRAVDDDTRVQTDAVTLQYLLDQYNIPVPVKLPYGMEPRVDQLEQPTLKNDQPQATPVP